MKITKNGRIIIEWWTPHIATIVCLIKPTERCKGCPGWNKKSTSNIDCPVASRWCG